jgi:dipeptidase D
MSGKLSELKPQLLWEYFEKICKVPRPSKKEEKISKYLIDFAEKHNLSYKLDDIGNILISKPATKGFENLKPVVLQSHLDMVGEKHGDVDHDFEKDPIIPYIADGWVQANGTTLGADDGIGIASQMAVLVDESIEHGPIECLFTVDEETGLTGAFALEPDFFNSRILINLDSEDWGELFIGCAGGRDTKAYFKYAKENVPEDSTSFLIKIKGLKGGHSGDEIHKGHGNAIKLLARTLLAVPDFYKMRISEISGGNLRNAIPREAEASVFIKNGNEAKFLDLINKMNITFRKELNVTAPELDLSARKNGVPEFVIDKATQRNLLYALHVCPHGEMAWSQDIPNLVETSTNLATLKMGEVIEVGTSQRSSIDSKLDDIVNTVQHAFALAEAQVESSSGYPGWEPNLDSEILKVTEESYKNLFNKEPEVKAIHAGLECGLIGKKYPGIDMISIGPTIKGAHTPTERINIQTTEEYWDLLLDVLKKVPKV